MSAFVPAVQIQVLANNSFQSTDTLTGWQGTAGDLLE